MLPVFPYFGSTAIEMINQYFVMILPIRVMHVLCKEWLCFWTFKSGYWQSKWRFLGSACICHVCDMIVSWVVHLFWLAACFTAGCFFSLAGWFVAAVVRPWVRFGGTWWIGGCFTSFMKMKGFHYNRTPDFLAWQIERPEWQIMFREDGNLL